MSWTLAIIALVLEAGMLGALVWIAYDLSRIIRNKETKPMVENNEDPEANIETGPVPVVEQPISTNEPDYYLTEAPMCQGIVLRDWLINHHPLRDQVWAAVVAEFYTRAADVPEILSYFKPVLEKPNGMAKLQQHFTRALMMVTGHGLSSAGLEYIRGKHLNVRDEDGRPIDGAIYDMVISTLVGILVEQKVPSEGIESLGRAIAPLKDVLVRG